MVNRKDNHYKKVSTTNIQITVQVAHDRQRNRMKALKKSAQGKRASAQPKPNEKGRAAISYSFPPTAP